MYGYAFTAAVCLWSGWSLHAYFTVNDQIKTVETVIEAAQEHEKVKVEVQTKFKTLYKEIDRVVEKPVYLNECFDPDGLRVLTEAIATSTNEPKSTVPGIERSE